MSRTQHATWGSSFLSSGHARCTCALHTHATHVHFTRELYTRATRMRTREQVDRRAQKKESETDYSFYDSHLEPKLKLSERATRSFKRRLR